MAVVAALSLLFAACSGDSGDSAAEDTTATTNPVARHHELTPDEIATYQTDLDAVGCWAGPVDGILGPRTESALREFQQAEGLTVTGLFGGESQNQLTAAAAAGEVVCGSVENASPRAVDEASIHELEVWQHDLNVVGCFAGAEDGTLGPQTEAAIRNYQTNAGLPVTGQLDPMTEETLAESAAEGGQICHAASSANSGSSPDAPDDGGGGLAGSGGGGAQAANCQVNSAGTWATMDQAQNYIAQLQAAGISGFGVTGGQGGTIVVKPDLTEPQAINQIATLNAAGFSGRYFCGT